MASAGMTQQQYVELVHERLAQELAQRVSLESLQAYASSVGRTDPIDGGGAAVAPAGSGGGAAAGAPAGGAGRSVGGKRKRHAV